MVAELIHIGFGNILAINRVIAIASPNSAPTKRLSAVRWGVAGNIVAAWILTFPVCAGLGYLFAWLMEMIF
ncbi:unnamed protein product [marine sediment metagenome]|uniref:Uncharacterized protein n=1 Tax=marine sediment metagenome TaxID=412755 RepID=X1QRV1_9ZZZZ